LRLSLFDIQGRTISMLKDGDQEAGIYRVHWDGRTAAGRPAASGVYFVTLVAGSTTVTRRLVVTN
jgi:hypothetical protein